MTPRSGVAEFTKVGEIVQRFDVPEQESQALASDIQSQLSGLPTVIADPETYRAAKEALPLLKRAEDKVVNFFRDIKNAAFKAHQAITTKETEQLKPIRDARTRVSSLIYGYEREQERIKRVAELEAARVEQERQQAAALEEAEALEAAGAPEMAAMVIEQAIAAPTPVIVLPSEAVEGTGVSMTANWQWRFVGDDEERAMRLLPLEYCCADRSKITKVVKAMKKGTQIPGIEVFDAGTVRVRG